MQNSSLIPVPAAYNDLTADSEQRDHFFNGELVAEHVGGHLPFQVEVQLMGLNLITVAVNNTLSRETIPPGDFSTIKLSSGRELVNLVPHFDFFNYAGILRSVYIWHLPQILIRGIRIQADHSVFASSRFLPTVPKSLLDVYRETFGFRTVTVDQNRIYINGLPFYCHGFGMHEDIGIHGRGFDRATMVKDLNMFDWLNGNCYRTSHYPYAEERAHLADRRGIAVITEVPAVGIWDYKSPSLLQLHAKMITEMISRDRNHPSVIMWSLSNEPKMPPNSGAAVYFENLVILSKQLDSTRPVTVVFGQESAEVKVASLLDVICVNDYFGWYRNIGMLELIQDRLVGKPVILSEYGAEAISGFNEQPSVAFSEQYQAELIHETGKALDVLRCSNDIAGEMLWNFADFMTAPSIDRVIGNHKGVLTRDRKPKLGAYAIQRRYKKLLENTTRTAKVCFGPRY
uniref:Glyco_hydro_2_C domain-containing protein n=1 Tax=Globodera pallida TaxID=36090 RepID=A0A183C991_GLOPA